MSPLQNAAAISATAAIRKKQNNEAALEPILRLAAIEDNFQAREAEGYQKNPEAVNPKPAAFTGSFDFTRELGRVGNEPVRQDQGHNPDGMLIKKIQRQLQLSVIHPPSGGPITGAVTMAML